MAQTRGRPTVQEWEEKKPQIEYLYLKHNMRLLDLRRHLESQGFYATPRQFKTRFKFWKLDTKKIKSDLWHAMYACMIARHERGLETVFCVPVRGEGLIWIRSDRVIKQIRRSDPNPDYDNAKQAEQILEKAGVKVCTTDRFPSSLSTNTSALVGQNSCSPPDQSQPLVLSDFASSDAEATGDEWTKDKDEYRDKDIHDDKNDNDNDNDDDVEDDEDDNEDDSDDDHKVDTKNDSQDNDDHSDSHEDDHEELLDMHGSQVDSLAISICTFKMCSSGPDSGASLSTLQVSDACKSPLSGDTDDPDIAAVMDWFVLDPACRARKAEEFEEQIEPLSIHSSGTAVPDEESRLAAQWITPYLLASLTQRMTSEIDTDFERQHAQQAFQIMVRSNNQFVFPVCNAVLIILAASGQNALLVEFLKDVCGIIDQSLGDHKTTYGSPFRFALALYTDNNDEVQFCSQECLQSSKMISLIWGPETPNFLVSRHHYGWHNMNLREYEEAIQVFSHCLPVSERIMGPRHLITVNCLAMWSRALSEIGRTSDAIAILRDAVDRLAHVTDLLDVYRYRLLFRLAGLEIETGEVANAEQNLRTVLDFRLNYFGIQHSQPWIVSDMLVELLISQGRNDESDSLSVSMSARYTAAEESPW